MSEPVVNDSDALMKSMGIDPELMDIRDRKRNSAGNLQDRRICICGHSVLKHRDGTNTKLVEGGDPNMWNCQPNLRSCPCKIYAPVLKVASTKFFLRVTDGPSDTHALMRGLRAMTQKHGVVDTFEWIVERQCVFCKTIGNDCLPTPLTADGRIKRSGTDGYDAFVCGNCRINEQLR